MAEKIERTYTIPLRKAWLNKPRYKRTPKAVRAVKEFLVKHMKSTDVKLGKELNDQLWKHGIKNPPCRIKVSVVKEDGKVMAELFGTKAGAAKAPAKPEQKKAEAKPAEKKEAPKVEAKPVAETKAAETAKPEPKAVEVKETPVAEVKKEAPVQEKKATPAPQTPSEKPVEKKTE
jgi:large subunit ribosomal protein L31e